MAPAKGRFPRAIPGEKSKSTMSGIPKFGVRTAKVTKSKIAVSKSAVSATFVKDSKLRFTGVNKSRKTVRFQDTIQDKISKPENRKVKVNVTEKKQDQMQFPTQSDQSEIVFEEDPDALASILNNEGVSRNLLQKSQVKNLNEEVKSADDFLLLPDGRPSLCRRVPVDRISFIGDGTRSSMISARRVPAPASRTSFLNPKTGRDSMRNSLYNFVESRYSQRGTNPAAPLSRKTFLHGGRASVIEYQGGSKLHMDNPQHIAVLNNLPIHSPAMRILKQSNFISESPAQRVRSVKKETKAGWLQNEVRSSNHHDNLAKALFQDEENVFPVNKRISRKTEPMNKFIKPKSMLPKKPPSNKTTTWVRNIPATSITNQGRATSSRISYYGNTKNGLAGATGIARPRALNGDKKKSMVSKKENNSNQTDEAVEINVVQPETLNVNIKSSSSESKLVNKNRLKSSTGCRNAGLGVKDVINLMQKKMESIKRRSVQAELTSMLKSVEMTLETATEEDEENVVQPEITSSKRADRVRSIPTFEKKNFPAKEDVDLKISDNSNQVQLTSPAVSEMQSWKQVLSSESSPSTWRDVLEKERTPSPRTQHRSTCNIASRVSPPVTEIRRESDAEISKLLRIKYEESLKQIKETADRSRKIEEEMKILQGRRKEAENEDITSEDTKRVCNEVKVKPAIQHEDPVIEANSQVKQKETLTTSPILTLSTKHVDVNNDNKCHEVTKEITSPTVRPENAKFVSWDEVKDNSGKITSGRIRQVNSVPSRNNGITKAVLKSSPGNVESQTVMTRKLATLSTGQNHDTPPSGQKSGTCRAVDDIFDSLALKRFTTPPGGHRTKTQTLISCAKSEKSQTNRVTPSSGKKQVYLPDSKSPMSYSIHELTVSSTGDSSCLLSSSGGVQCIPARSNQHVSPPGGRQQKPSSSQTQQSFSQGQTWSKALSSFDSEVGIFSDTFLQNVTQLSPKFPNGKPSDDLEWMKLIYVNSNMKMLDSEVFLQTPTVSKAEDNKTDTTEGIRDLLNKVKSLQMQNEIIKKGAEGIESMLKLSKQKSELSNDKSLKPASGTGRGMSRVQPDRIVRAIEPVLNPSIHDGRDKGNSTYDGQKKLKNFEPLNTSSVAGLSGVESDRIVKPLKEMPNPSDHLIHDTRDNGNDTNYGQKIMEVKPWEEMRSGCNLIDFSICEDDSGSSSSMHLSSVILNPIEAQQDRMDKVKLRPTTISYNHDDSNHQSTFTIAEKPGREPAIRIERKKMVQSTKPAFSTDNLNANNSNIPLGVETIIPRILQQHAKQDTSELDRKICNEFPMNVADANGQKHTILPSYSEKMIAEKDKLSATKNILNGINHLSSNTLISVQNLGKSEHTEQNDLPRKSDKPANPDGVSQQSYNTSANTIMKDKILPTYSQLNNLPDSEALPQAAHPNENMPPPIPENIHLQKMNQRNQFHGLPKPVIVTSHNSAFPIKTNLTQNPKQSFKTIVRPSILAKIPIKSTDFSGSLLPPGVKAKHQESICNTDDNAKIMIPKPIKQPPPETPSAFRQLRRKLREGSPSPRKPRQRSPYSIRSSSKGISKISRSKPSSSSLLASPAFKSVLKRRFAEALLDEEVSMLTCRTTRATPRKSREKSTSNPLGRVLLEGDETHFIPLSPFISKSKPKTIAGSAFSTYNNGI